MSDKQTAYAMILSRACASYRDASGINDAFVKYLLELLIRAVGNHIPADQEILTDADLIETTVLSQAQLSPSSIPHESS